MTMSAATNPSSSELRHATHKLMKEPCTMPKPIAVYLFSATSIISMSQMASVPIHVTNLPALQEFRFRTCQR
jgi:hypothetical protein